MDDEWEVSRGDSSRVSYGGPMVSSRVARFYLATFLGGRFPEGILRGCPHGETCSRSAGF